MECSLNRSLEFLSEILHDLQLEVHYNSSLIVSRPTSIFFYDILAGEDYRIDAITEVNLHPEQKRRAFYVQLIDDQLPEESESLELQLSIEGDQPRITIGQDTTTVNIEDNDGGYKYHTIMNLLLVCKNILWFA